MFHRTWPFFIETCTGPERGERRKLHSLLGTLQIGCRQAQQLGVKPRIQQSPLLELCCLRMAAKSSYQDAQADVELFTGIRVSAKTQERIVKRNPMAPAQCEEEVDELTLDGGMVRLVTPKGEASEWKQYKAMRVNGNGVAMAWFQSDAALLSWVKTLCSAAILFCLGDGHPGIWSLYQQIGITNQRDEILDWFHLKENLHKVGGSLKRLRQAEGLLWEGESGACLGLIQRTQI